MTRLLLALAGHGKTEHLIQRIQRLSENLRERSRLRENKPSRQGYNRK